QCLRSHKLDLQQRRLQLPAGRLPAEESTSTVPPAAERRVQGQPSPHFRINDETPGSRPEVFERYNTVSQAERMEVLPLPCSVHNASFEIAQSNSIISNTTARTLALRKATFERTLPICAGRLDAAE